MKMNVFERQGNLENTVDTIWTISDMRPDLIGYNKNSNHIYIPTRFLNTYYGLYSYYVPDGTSHSLGALESGGYGYKNYPRLSNYSGNIIYAGGFYVSSLKLVAYVYTINNGILEVAKTNTYTLETPLYGSYDGALYECYNPIHFEKDGNNFYILAYLWENMLYINDTYALWLIKYDSSGDTWSKVRVEQGSGSSDYAKYHGGYSDATYIYISYWIDSENFKIRRINKSTGAISDIVTETIPAGYIFGLTNDNKNCIKEGINGKIYVIWKYHLIEYSDVSFSDGLFLGNKNFGYETHTYYEIDNEDIQKITHIGYNDANTNYLYKLTEKNYKLRQQHMGYKLQLWNSSAGVHNSHGVSPYYEILIKKYSKEGTYIRYQSAYAEKPVLYAKDTHMSSIQYRGRVFYFTNENSYFTTGCFFEIADDDDNFLIEGYIERDEDPLDAMYKIRCKTDIDLLKKYYFTLSGAKYGYEILEAMIAESYFLTAPSSWTYDVGNQLTDFKANGRTGREIIALVEDLSNALVRIDRFGEMDLIDDPLGGSPAISLTDENIINIDVKKDLYDVNKVIVYGKWDHTSSTRYSKTYSNDDISVQNQLIIEKSYPDLSDAEIDSIAESIFLNKSVAVKRITIETDEDLSGYEYGDIINVLYALADITTTTVCYITKIRFDLETQTWYIECRDAFYFDWNLDLTSDTEKENINRRVDALKTQLDDSALSDFDIDISPTDLLPIPNNTYLQWKNSTGTPTNCIKYDNNNEFSVELPLFTKNGIINSISTIYSLTAIQLANNIALQHANSGFTQRNSINRNSSNILEIGDSTQNSGLKAMENLDVNSKIISNLKEVRHYSEYDNGNSSTSKTIYQSNGIHQKMTMTGNCTVTLSFSGVGKLFLKLIQDATGGRTIGFVSTIYWEGGIAPSLSGANKTDILLLYYDGSNYYGSCLYNMST